MKSYLKYLNKVRFIIKKCKIYKMNMTVTL